MVRMIKCIDKKRYIKDMKTRRQWGLLELREKERQGKKKREERKEKQRTQEKRNRRFRLDTVTMREIRKFKKTTCFLIRNLPFARWV